MKRNKNCELCGENYIYYGTVKVPNVRRFYEISWRDHVTSTEIFLDICFECEKSYVQWFLSRRENVK